MNYEPILFALGILIFYWGFNLRKKDRYRQWKVALAALTLFLVSIYFYMDAYLFHTRIGQILHELSQAAMQAPATQEYIAYMKQIRPETVIDAQKMANHEANLALFYELFLFAFLVFLLFGILKIIYVVFGWLISLILKPKPRLNGFTSIFYRPEHDGVYLKSEFVAFGDAARYFGSALLLIVFTLPIAGFIAGNDYFLDIFQPPMLLLSALLLMEIGFFLGGTPYVQQLGGIESEEGNVRNIRSFAYLYDRYRAELDSKILASTVVENDQERKDLVLPRLDISYFDDAMRQFKKEGRKINVDYFTGIDKLFSWRQKGKKPNVLFSNAYDEQFEPYLQLFLEFSYFSNKKVIVPVLTELEKERTMKWIRETIEENIFEVHDCNFFDYSKKRHHILVDTLDCVIKDAILQKHMTDFHFMLLMDLKEYIRKDHLFLNTFLQLYRAITAKTPQILGFSNIPNELEPSFNLIFVGANDDTSEIKIRKKEEKRLYLIVFDASGERYQDVLNIDKGLYLGQEVPLAYFAHREAHISPIVVSSKSSSLEEEFEELCKGIDCSVTFKKAIKQIDDRHYNHLTDEHALFIVDDQCNLAQTIQKWRNYPLSEELFLVIVSSPYLLREYFSRNIALLVDDSEFFIELLPKGGLSQHEKAFMLLLSLSLNELKRDEIDLDEVSRESIATYISDNVENVELHASEILVNIRKEFNGNYYEEVVYYSISQKNYSPQVHYYTFENTQREALSMCLEDDIYHKYHEGMTITIFSRAYRIRSINHHRKVITVEFIPTIQIPSYEIEKKIIFEAFYADDAKQILEHERNGVTLKARYIDIDYLCLFSAFTEIGTGMRTSTRSAPEHHYEKRVSLQLSFVRTEGFSRKLKNAFAYLLAEVFKVYFPHHYHLIGIEMDPEGERGENSFEVIILEMAKINYHLLSTIIEEKYFRKILMLMEDVILWSQELDIPLSYGARKEQGPEMDFEALRVFLSQYLMGENEITLHRKNIQGLEKKRKRADTAHKDTSQHQCDFCSSELPAGQFEQLSDGRERCIHCSEQTREKIGIESGEMFKEALTFLEKRYGIKIDTAVEIEILNSDSLHRKIGKAQIISKKYDPRAVGIAIKENGKKLILIENEAPYFREISTLVHELTHIWQYDHLDIEQIPESMKVLEGHAMLTELQYLREKFPEEKSYIDSEIKRTDIYGEGYRYISAELQKNRIDNPFTLLSRLYG